MSVKEEILAKLGTRAAYGKLQEDDVLYYVEWKGKRLITAPNGKSVHTEIELARSAFKRFLVSHFELSSSAEATALMNEFLESGDLKFAKLTE